MTPPAAEKNKLGLWTSTSLVVGNMVGSGVFLLPSALASYGSISLVAWVLSSIGALCLAKIFSRLSVLLPDMDGGPYAYTRKGFGDFAGFLIAWGYWISVWTTNATLAVAFVGSLSTFFPSLATNPVLAVVTGLGAIWFLTWINTRGIRRSGTMQLLTTILKLVPLIVISFVGIFYIHRNHFPALNLSGGSTLSALLSAVTLTFFAFLGVECATIPAGSVANPEKTIPRATMIGTILTTIIYIVSTITIMGLIDSNSLQHSVTPFADAAAILFGESARYGVAAGVAIAAFGALNGWILIQGQMPFAIAKDKLFPPIFAKQNSKGAPAAGLILSSVLASGFILMNYSRALVEQFRFMVLVSTITSVVPYLFVAAAYLVVNFHQGRLPIKKWIQVITLGSVTFLFSFYAIAGSGQEAVFWGFMLLLAGIPFYVWVLWKQSANKPLL